MIRNLPRLLGAALPALVLQGCLTTTPPSTVHQPMTARPVPVDAPAVANGSIYQANYQPQAFYGYRPLFEDRRARMVGDSGLGTRGLESLDHDRVQLAADAFDA